MTTSCVTAKSSCKATPSRRDTSPRRNLRSRVGRLGGSVSAGIYPSPMKAYTTHKTPTASTPSGNCLASNTVRIARLVFALIVVLAQPVHAQGTSPDAQQVRTELGTVVTDLRAALAQLARIEAEAATLPKTFTAGGQTQNRWNQLNAEKERWTTEQGKALDRFDQLVTQSKALPPGNAAVADLLTICTQLLARNDVALKAAQSKLSGIEGTLRRGPSTFAKGSQIEVWQTQLNREKEYWTGNLATLGKEHEKLAAHLATLKAQSNPAKVVAGATEPAKVVATVPSKVIELPEDKNINILNQIEQAVKAAQEFTNTGKAAEAFIQYEKASELHKLLTPLYYKGKGLWGSRFSITPQKNPGPHFATSILHDIAEARNRYPAAKAEYQKMLDLDTAIEALHKEKAMTPEGLAQAKRDAEKETAMKKPIRSLEDAVAVVNGKLFGEKAEYKVGKEMISLGGITPKNTMLYPVRFENGRDAYFFKDEFDEWNFYEKGTTDINLVKNFR